MLSTLSHWDIITHSYPFNVKEGALWNTIGPLVVDRWQIYHQLSLQGALELKEAEKIKSLDDTEETICSLFARRQQESKHCIVHKAILGFLSQWNYAEL